MYFILQPSPPSLACELRTSFSRSSDFSFVCLLHCLDPLYALFLVWVLFFPCLSFLSPCLWFPRVYVPQNSSLLPLGEVGRLRNCRQSSRRVFRAFLGKQGGVRSRLPNFGCTLPECFVAVYSCVCHQASYPASLSPQPLASEVATQDGAPVYPKMGLSFVGTCLGVSFGQRTASLFLTSRVLTIVPVILACHLALCLDHGSPSFNQCYVLFYRIWRYYSMTFPWGYQPSIYHQIFTDLQLRANLS